MTCFRVLNASGPPASETDCPHTDNGKSIPLEEMAPGCCSLYRAGIYSLYVLMLFVIAYLLNQLDRYMLGIVTRPMAQDLEYGDQACMANSSFSSKEMVGITCSNATTEQRLVHFEKGGSS